MVKSSDISVDRVRYQHTEVLIPVTSGTQAEIFLFGSDFRDIKHHVSLGDFYEIFSAGVFGGKRNNREYVRNGDGKIYDLRLVKADIVDIPKKSVREIKGNKWTQQLNLLDPQMSRYIDYMRSKPELIPTLESDRHRFEGIKSYRGSREDLFSALASNTAYGWRLPISVALALWSLPDKRGFEGYAEHYETIPKEKRKPGSKPFDPCTRVKNSALIKILENPRDFFVEIGLNPGNFTFRRVLSPENFQVEGFIVSQFPILDIVENQLF